LQRRSSPLESNLGVRIHLDAEASKLHHGYIWVHHLILALLNPPEPTVVLELLGALGISYDDELDNVRKGIALAASSGEA